MYINWKNVKMALPVSHYKLFFIYWTKKLNWLPKRIVNKIICLLILICILLRHQPSIRFILLFLLNYKKETGFYIIILCNCRLSDLFQVKHSAFTFFFSLTFFNVWMFNQLFHSFGCDKIFVEPTWSLDCTAAEKDTHNLIKYSLSSEQIRVHNTILWSIFVCAHVKL